MLKTIEIEIFIIFIKSLFKFMKFHKIINF
jgi:hypothetical protein